MDNILQIKNFYTVLKSYPYSANRDHENLFRSEFSEPCMFDKPVKRFYRKDLPSCRQDHFFHIFPANSKASPTNAGDDFILRVVFGAFRKA